MDGMCPRRANIRALSILRTVGVVLVLAACSRPPQGDDRVFVSDESANVLHVFDGATGRKERDLHTGARPRGLTLSPDKRVLYVAVGDSNRIEAWDSHSLKKLRDIASGSDPERLAISPDGKTIYAANEDKSAVSFVDIATGRLMHEVQVGPEPEGIGVSPDGKLLIATSEVASVAHFIDVPSARVVANLPVGSRPREVLFLKGGREAWVSSEQRGTVHVFDIAARRQVRVIDLAAAFPGLAQAQAIELELTRDGKRAFVAMGRGDQVAEIDPRTYRVVRAFPTGHRTWGISLAPDDSRLYAASGLSGTVTVIDLKANKAVRTVARSTESPGRPRRLRDEEVYRRLRCLLLTSCGGTAAQGVRRSKQYALLQSRRRGFREQASPKSSRPISAVRSNTSGGPSAADLFAILSARALATFGPELRLVSRRLQPRAPITGPATCL